MRLPTPPSTALSCLAVALLSPLAQAQWPPYDYANQYVPTGGVERNQSIDYVAPLPIKYQVWYGDYRVQLEEISTGVCNLSLRAYRGDMEAREILGPVHSYCFTHSNCILSTITPEISQSIAGASILLGLTPTILTVLGPSVAELALLSMHRPFLSVLLTLGAPAIFPGRFLVWDDPLRANDAATGAFVVPRFHRRAVIVAITVVEYMLALGAVANIIDNTIGMGVRSVLTWYSDSSYWPTLWVVFALVTQVIAVVSLRVAMSRKRGDRACAAQRSFGFRSMLWSEFTLSANAETQVRDHFDVRLGPLAVLLQYVGALVALVLLIFGTAMFSSLLYIGNGDAIALVLRFTISAVMCRILLQFEIGGMIRVGEERKIYRGIVQPAIHEEPVELVERGKVGKF